MQSTPLAGKAGSSSGDIWALERTPYGHEKESAPTHGVRHVCAMLCSDGSAVHCRAFAEERAQALGTSLRELTGATGSSGSGGFFETGEEARRRWREQRDSQDQQEREEPVSIAKGADLAFL